VSVDDAENRKVCDTWKNWYTGTISTRGIAKGAVHIIGQQRVSIYDPSSVALAENKESELEGRPPTWHHVCLPMRYERSLAMQDRGFGGDWRTKEGELLYPQLLTEEKVKKTERSLGPRRTRAQLQQQPQAIEGQVLPTEMIKMIKPNEVPKCELWVRFWDKAATPDGGCRTAGVAMGLRRTSADSFNYVFTHVHKGHWGTDRVEAEIAKMALGDSMKYGNDDYYVGVEREPGSGGVFSVNATKRRLRDYKVRDIRAGKDKIVTAESLAVAMGFGEVYCVEAEWTPEFIAELTDAPHGEYMDQFDAAAKAVILANEEIAKKKKRALVSGMDRNVQICISPNCDRPAAEGLEYCCPICELTAEFNDPTMPVDHPAECNQRAHKFFNRRN
jgi:phage terminase large subunit-like protein